MSSEMGQYLRATFTIEAEHEKIIETVTNVTRGCSSDEEKAIKLFYFVRDSIRYNIYMISVFIEDFRASRILEWGKAYCVQRPESSAPYCAWKGCRHSKQTCLCQDQKPYNT